MPLRGARRTETPPRRPPGFRCQQAAGERLGGRHSRPPRPLPGWIRILSPTLLGITGSVSSLTRNGSQGSSAIISLTRPCRLLPSSPAFLLKGGPKVFQMDSTSPCRDSVGRASHARSCPLLFIWKHTPPNTECVSGLDPSPQAEHLEATDRGKTLVASRKTLEGTLTQLLTLPFSIRN